MHKELNVSIAVTYLHKSLGIGMVTVLQLWSSTIDENSIICGHVPMHACALRLWAAGDLRKGSTIVL